MSTGFRVVVSPEIVIGAKKKDLTAGFSPERYAYFGREPMSDYMSNSGVDELIEKISREADFEIRKEEVLSIMLKLPFKTEVLPENPGVTDIIKGMVNIASMKNGYAAFHTTAGKEPKIGIGVSCLTCAKVLAQSLGDFVPEKILIMK